MFVQKGLLIVLSGPSGVGKGTVCSSLRHEQEDIIYSVSAHEIRGSEQRPDVLDCL